MESGLLRDREARTWDRWESSGPWAGRGHGGEKLVGRERRATVGRFSKRAGVSWLQLWQAMRSKR